MAKFENHITINVDVQSKEIERLTNELEASEGRAGRLASTLEFAKEKIDELEETIENLKNGQGIAILEKELESFRYTAQKAFSEFEAFLVTANLKDADGLMPSQFRDLAKEIENGAETVHGAITRVKDDYGYLIDMNSSGSGGFDTDTLYHFVATLKTIESTLETVLQKITIMERDGVKAVESIGNAGSGAGTGGLGNIDLLFERIKEATHDMSDETRVAVEQIANMFSAMQSLGAVDDEKLLVISQSFKNIAAIGAGKFGDKAINNIVYLVKQLQAIAQGGASDIRFNVSGLSDINIRPSTVTAIKALSELNLESLSGAKISKDAVSALQDLGSIDLSKLSDIKVYKSSVNAIRALTEIDFASLKGAKLSADALKALQSLGEIDLSKFDGISIKKSSTDAIKALISSLSGIDRIKVDPYSIQAIKDITTVDFEKLNSIKVHKSAITALTSLGEVSKSLKNISNLKGISEIDLSNMKEIKVDKGSLKQLGESLKAISSANIEKLIALGMVDFSNFNNIKVGTDSLSSIAAVTTALGEMVKAVADYNRVEANRQKQTSAPTNKEEQEIIARNKAIEAGNKLLAQRTAETARWLDASVGSTSNEYERLVELREALSLYNKQLVDGEITVDEYKEKLAKLNAEHSKAASAIIRAEENTNKNTKANEKANTTREKAVDLQNRLNDAVSKAASGGSKVPKSVISGLKEQQKILSDLLNTYGKAPGATSKFNTSLNSIERSLKKYSKDVEKAEDDTKSWFDKVKEAASSQFGMVFGAAALFRKGVQQVREMIDTVIELDTAMTQLRIVTDDTDVAYEKYSNTIAKTAKEIGVSITDLISATTTYARLGYSLDESSMLAKYTGMLQKVGDIDTQEAQDSITSITKAFSNEINIDDIESVMDRLVITGNNYPISVSQLAEGMKNASSALSAAGNSFDQSVALLMGANVSLQNASKSSTGLRTIAARLRNTKAELDELGESMEESKYEDLVSGLTQHNVALRDANGEYRSTYDILKDIAAQWKNMTSMEQSALATAIAGTRQQNVFYSVIQNFDEVKDSMVSMQESAGELQSSYTVHLNSIEAHTNQFKASFQELSRTLIDSDLIKEVVDFGTKIIEILTKIAELIDKLGGLKTIAIALTGVLTAKSIGKVSNIFNTLSTKITDIVPKLTSMGEKFSSIFVSSSVASGITSVSGAMGRLETSAGSLFSSISGKLAGMSGPISAFIAGLGLVVSAINARNKKIEEDIDGRLKIGEAARSEYDEIMNLSTAYEEAESAFYSGTGTKEAYEAATNNLVTALGYEADEVDYLISRYGSLNNAISQLKSKETEDAINNALDGIDAAKDKAMRAVANDRYFGTLSWGNNDIARTSTIMSQLGYEGMGIKNYIEFDVDNDSFEGVKKKYDELLALQEDMLRGVDKGYYTREYLKSSDVWKALQNELSTLSAVGEYYDLFSEELYMAVDKTYQENINDSGLPQTEEALSKLVDDIYEQGTKNGTIITEAGEDAEVVKEKIRSILSLKPELDSIFNPPNTGRTSGVTIPAVLSAQELASALGALKSNFDLIDSATQEMSETGSVSVKTIQAMAEVTDDYTKYLYREGDAIKLNTELWRDFVNQDAHQEMDNLNAANDALATENNSLESLLGPLKEQERLLLSVNEKDADWARKLTEVQNNISAITSELDSNSTAIEENQRKLDILSATLGNTKVGTSPQMERQMSELKWNIEELIVEKDRLEKAYGLIASREYEAAQKEAEALGYSLSDLVIKYGQLSSAILENQDLLSIYEGMYDSMADSVTSAAEAYSGFEAIANKVNVANDAFETLANLQAKVGQGFQMSLNDALEFANVYPEIMDKAQVTADGQIILNEAVVNSFLDAKQAEIKGSIDAEIRKLQADKETLIAKKTLAEAQLDLALQVAQGESDLTLEEARFKVSTSNAIAEALIANGVQEADAYRLATEAMAGNFSDFDAHALEVAKNVLTNMSTSASQTSLAYYNAAIAMINNLDKVAQQGVKTANAVKTGGYTGSVSASGSGNDITQSMYGQTAATYQSAQKFSYNAQMLELDDFIAELELDISNYQNAIDQIDGQIATLQALRDRPLEDYVSSGTSKSDSGSGSGSGSGSDSGGGGSSSEETKELFDWIEVKIKRIEEAVSRLDTVAGSTYRSWSERNKALSKEISEIEEEILTQNAAYEAYMKIAEGVGLSSAWKKKVQSGALDIDTVTNESLKEQIKLYQEYYDKAMAAKDAVLELQETESSKYRERFDNVAAQYDSMLSVIESKRQMIDAGIKQTETRGYIVSTNYYKALQEIENKNIKQLEKERDALVSSLSAAVDSGAIKKGSEEWYNMCQQIDAVTISIQEANTSILEYSNSIRDIEWQIFDLIQEKISNVTEEADFLINLMADNKLFDDRGQLTDQGTATMGLHGMNFNTYMIQAQKYAEEIKRINEEIANDPYNQTLIERRQELIDLQRESILSANEEKMAIRDLVEEGIEAELESIKSLIDAYNEATESQKDMYEYQKKVAEQTEEIAAIQKQLAAYEGDDSEENRSRLQKLRTSLEEAEENLRETEYDKYISDQKEILDNLYNEYETVLNSRLDNIDLLISDMILYINENSDNIAVTLEEVAGNVGITLSDIMRETWTSEDAALGIVKDGIVTAIDGVNGSLGSSFITITNEHTAIQTAINSIGISVSAMITRLDSIANKELKLVIPQAEKQEKKDGDKKKDDKNKGNSPGKEAPKKSADGDENKGRTLKESYGVALAIWNGNYGWGSGTTRKQRLKAKGFDYSTVQAIVKKLGDEGYIYGDKWKGKYYGITSLAPYHYNKFAVGSKRIPYSQYGWTQEDGNEVIIRPSDGAILTPLAKGDAVLSAEATRHLWEFTNDPTKFIKDAAGVHGINSSQQEYGPGYTQNFENVVFSMPNVRNYDELIRQMQRDKNFEGLIQAMADKTASPIRKYKAIR